MKKKKDVCQKHGERTFIKDENWSLFACVACLVTSMHPLSPLCPVHYWTLEIDRDPGKRGYCKDCDKYYELCDVKVSIFNSGAFHCRNVRGHECIKFKGHKCKHKSPYGLEYNKTEQPKMDFEGGVFRRVEVND